MRRFLFFLISLYEKLFAKRDLAKPAPKEEGKKDDQDIYPLF